MTKCYSTDGEQFDEDFPCDLEEVGQVYYEGDRVDISLESVIRGYAIESFLENLDETVYEDVGEIYDNCFTNTTKEQKEELLKLVLGWAKEHVNIPYWSVKNIVERVATEEDL